MKGIKSLLAFITVASYFNAASQPKTTSGSAFNLTKLDIGLEGIGITVERKLATKTVIDFSAGIGGGYDKISKSTISYSWDMGNPGLYVSVSPKFLYNINKRASQEKNIKYNSASYVGAKLKIGVTNLLSVYDPVNTVFFNLHWGLQRNIARRCVFSCHVGMGYASEISNTTEPANSFYPAFDFKFSYVL